MKVQRLLIGDLQLLASGNNREVYVHPSNSDLLIKIMKGSDGLNGHGAIKAAWRKRLFRRYRQYIEFLRESREYIAGFVGDDEFPSFMQTVVGFVQTDRGLGLVVKAERDKFGGYAKTVEKIIADGEFDENVQRAIDGFREDFWKSNIIVTDANLRNLVYSCDDFGVARIVVVDGYGEKNFIPFNTAFRWCHEISKRKRLKRLDRALKRALDQQESGKASGGV